TVVSAGLKMIQFARADPVAFVVGGEQILVGAVEAQAIRRPEAAANAFETFPTRVDLHAPANVRHVPPTALSTECDVKIVLPIDDRSEGERVIVAGEAPGVVDPLVAIGLAVVVGIYQTRELAFLNDIDLVVEHFEAERFVESARESAVGSQFNRSLCILDDINLAQP